MGVRAICVIIGLTMGNYLHEIIFRHDWFAAADHSILQALAIGCLWLSVKIDPLPHVSRQ